MTRLRIFAAALVLVPACAAVTQARAYPKPPLGAWKLDGSGGAKFGDCAIEFARGGPK